MKYVAVCVLSVLTMLSASASPSVPVSALVAAQVVPSAVGNVADEFAARTPDSLLMTLLGGALIALQLRRRQKSLRSPRLAILSG